MNGAFAGCPRGSWHNVEVSVPNATLRNDAVRKRFHRLHGASQDSDFKTVTIVDMDMKRGHGQIVMVMLDAGEPFRQLPCLGLVDIGERREARQMSIAGGLVPGDGIANDIAERFRSASIAATLAQPVDRLKQVVVNADGNALHRRLFLRQRKVKHCARHTRMIGTSKADSTNASAKTILAAPALFPVYHDADQRALRPAGAEMLIP
jgi:hypothetical protein